MIEGSKIFPILYWLSISIYYVKILFCTDLCRKILKSVHIFHFMTFENGTLYEESFWKWSDLIRSDSIGFFLGLNILIYEISSIILKIATYTLRIKINGQTWGETFLSQELLWIDSNLIDISKGWSISSRFESCVHTSITVAVMYLFNDIVVRVRKKDMLFIILLWLLSLSYFDKILVIFTYIWLHLIWRFLLKMTLLCLDPFIWMSNVLNLKFFYIYVHNSNHLLLNMCKYYNSCFICKHWL